jgi:mRNA-degrading endonuclease YafQ of YafQ-DinJ toxin-antitoxin module
MRKIVVSKQFEKKLILFLRRRPELENKISSVLKTLEKDLNSSCAQNPQASWRVVKIFCMFSYLRISSSFFF